MRLCLIVAALTALTAACGGNGNSNTPRPTFLYEVPNPTYPEGSPEQQVSVALLDLYDKIAAADYQTAWEGYTGSYRAACSFDSFVATWDRTREAYAWDAMLIRGVAISVSGEQADASFTVYPRKNGEVIPGSAYSDSITFKRETGTWLAEDECFGPST